MKIALGITVTLACAGIAQIVAAEPVPAPATVAESPVNIAEMSRGQTYFNRPGATGAEHNADVDACMKLAHAARAVDELIGNDRGLIPALLSADPKKGVYAAAIENCMVVRGWRVVRLPAEAGTALASLPPVELSARIAPWVGAEMPPHEIIRVWDNDAARAATTRFEIRPAFVNQGSLSVVAVSRSAEAINSPRPFTTLPRIKLDKKWPKKPLKPEQIASAPPGSAVIIAHITGVSMRNGVALNFMRDWTDNDTPASAVDHAPDSFWLVQGVLGAKPEGHLVAMAVPPGRWRIAGMGMMPAISFCLGAPSFEVAAGDIIYAGSFDMSAEELTPDLSLAPAQAFLAGQPAADRLKPAHYTNGTVAPCGGSILYALEFEGAPFAPGYAWGSLAGNPGAVVPAPPGPESVKP